MVFVVGPALIPDIEKVYDIYFSAFGADHMGRIISKILFPGGITPEFRKAHTHFTLEWWKNCDYQYTMKCMDTETGDIVGMGLGDFYLAGRSEEKRKNPGVTWLEGKERERAEKILDPLWEARERIWGGKPYIYIHVFAVDPDFQGRGAGLRLVQWGVEISERTKVPIYFEASPTTVKLYERAGIRRLKEQVVHKAEDLGTDEDITVPLMVYVPISGKSPFDESMFAKRQTYLAYILQWLMILWWSFTNYA